ncbi:MAG TPA: glycosyltransferase family 39 protein [Galbitalea sp.]|jgi:4-amino-4-deoxy-L-arabinose transferase-like glycosyltransferase|nr:glycosyltransferase family 39 protein [Galbitalea sp.]
MTTTTSTNLPAPSKAVGSTGIGDRVRRLVFGARTADRWERPSFLGLLVVTGVLYLWNLAASGWANSFYSAAVQAGSTNWEAFFYGSSDAANSITVDKPPASLWLMELSVKLFGLSSFSILLPEALMGIATVAIVYATVRRSFSARTALLAGGVLAVTPVAALMFRFNNPDALLVVLMSLAVYFTIRGIESGKLRWVLWAGAMVGFGFLTKQLQAFVILPALAGIYLAAAPGTRWRRIRHLLAALAAVIVSAGWWVAVVTLVPANLRPYIGGSQTNSFLELTFGYNGLGRIDGSETGSVTGGGGGNAAGGMWGATGILRMFQDEIGGQISWLLPAALVLALVSFIVLRGARTDLRRATLMLFTAWLVITALVFSFAEGIFHAYYTVALAPAIAGVVAMGASVLWSYRDELWSRIIAAVVVLGTVTWGFVLLSEASDWMPWVKWVALTLGVAAAVLLLLPQHGRELRVASVGLAIAASLLGPLAWTLETVSVAHSGSIVTAGPTVASSMGGGFGGAGGGRGFGGARGGQPQTGVGQQGGTAPTGGGQIGTAPTGNRAGTGTPGGGAGSLLNSATVGSAVTRLLETDASKYSWVAAAIGSNSAAGYQLATQEAVMPIGGFNGSDPSPTLAEFKADVSAGEIHYFIGGSVGAANGGSNVSSQIASWVEANFTAQTVDGVTLYDLTK